MICAYRILHRLARKAAKPICLWLTELRHNRSVSQVIRLQELRSSLNDAERAEHINQVALAMRRTEISRW